MSLLSTAIRRYAGTPDTSDAVSFQRHRGGVICFIRGVGATGKTPDAALRKAMAEWARIEGRRRTSRRTR
jgi:ribosomal protein S12